MEIVIATAESSKKQMSEVLTSTTSAEGSGKNNITSGAGSGSTANSSATAISTIETRTKDSKNTTTTTQNITNMNAAGASDTSDKDMDIEIIEIPPIKTTAPGEYTKLKIDDKNQQQQHSAKLITSNVAGGIVQQLDDDIPIISISDGEDSGGQPTQSAQKVNRKRNSMGGSAVEDDQQFRLKRRKIKVAGAPKMPLTGYVRYMNERREILRKELPTKTAIEHTKIIGEEWQKMTEDKKAPYMKAAELDKQRYLTELHTFLKERPDVLACELAKNKQARKSPGEAGKPILKEKSQSIGNIKSPNKETNTAGPAVNKDKINHSSEKDNSPSPGQITAATTTITTASSSSSATTTTMDNKSRRKRTPTPTNVGGTNNSNSNNNNNNNNKNTHANTNNINTNNNHNSNTNNHPNSNSTATTTTTISTAINANIATSLLAATAVPGEIPIFTNEFLEHNKIFDMELRTLRKSKVDLEQQNAVLEKHVENMKFGVEKMTNENDELAEKNRLLELYLEKLKTKLAHALSGLSIPSQPNGATIDNIEKYMCDLYKMATTNTHGPASLNKAKDIIRKLDLQINL